MRGTGRAIGDQSFTSGVKRGTAKARQILIGQNCHAVFRQAAKVASGITGFMTLQGVALQEIIHRQIATIEGLSIMAFQDRLFVPGGRDHARLHVRFSSAAMAARNLAFGAGGFSSKFSTKRLSRSDRTKRCDSSMTAFASRKAGCRTKSGPYAASQPRA